MADDLGALGVGVKAATEGLFQPAVNNLLSPPSKEVGELLGTIANVARFYATENMKKIFTRWAKHRSGEKQITETDFKKIMLLLPAASMVSDDELQEKWAILLENAISEDGFLPSFGQTLSQLSVEEVRYLDRLWPLASTPNGLASFEPGRLPLSYGRLIGVFDPNIKRHITQAEMKLYGDRFSEEQKLEFERFQHAKVVVDDIVRIGILVADKVVEPGDSIKIGEIKLAAAGSGTKFRIDYLFSPYGVAFMRAVTSKL